MQNGFGLQLSCVMAAEGLLNGSWSALGGPLEPKTYVLGTSWGRLGALGFAPQRPEGDRPEVGRRWGQHLWLARAPGERHLSKNID